MRNWLNKLFGGSEVVSAQSGVVYRGVGANLRVNDDNVGALNPVPTEPRDRLLDTFGRNRVSNPITLFEVQHQYNEQPLLWQTTTATGGSISHLPNESSVSMDVTTSNGSLAQRQTFEHFRYQPGKSQFVLLTGVMGAAKTGVRQRIGYFNSDNGVFFEQDSNNLKIVRRTSTSGSVSDVVVNQSSWNIDTADGNGPSGFNVDTSLAQLFVIDLQWLGVGKIRYGFYTSSGLVYVHEDPNTNELSTPYMTTANLPITYEIENTAGTVSNSTMKQICSSVISEGGFIREGIPFSANNGVTAVSVGTSALPVLSIRPKATFNSIDNNALILPVGFSAFSAGDFFFEIVHAGTLTGSPSWTSVDSNSIVEFDVAASGLTGGRVIRSGYASAGGTGESGEASTKDVLSKLVLTGTDVLTVRATSIAGTNNTYASFNWMETY
jgi:hypothetical protein